MELDREPDVVFGARSFDANQRRDGRHRGGDFGSARGRVRGGSRGHYGGRTRARGRRFRWHGDTSEPTYDAAEE